MQGSLYLSFDSRNMKELIKIQHELKAPKGQFNSFANFNYRSLEDILEALKPLLWESKCFLYLSDRVEQIGERYYVRATATLVNSEAQQISVSACAREAAERKGMDSSQITGATSSYARKYALNGLFAIDDTKDADGQEEVHSEVRKVKSASADSGSPRPASEKQIKYLHDLGAEVPEGLTFAQAQVKISALVNDK